MGDASARSHPSRRTFIRVLVGAMASGVVTACRGAARSVTTPTISTPSGVAHTPVPKAEVDPVETLAQRVATDEARLISAYDDAITANPALATTLRALRADHVAHLRALVPGAALPTPTAATSAGAMARSGAPASGSTAAAVLPGLSDAENAAAAARVDDLMTAPGNLARLLASIGACEASHVQLLKDAQAGGAA